MITFVSPLAPELKEIIDRLAPEPTATEAMENLCVVRELALADESASQIERSEPVLWLLRHTKREWHLWEFQFKQLEEAFNYDRQDMIDATLMLTEIGGCVPLNFLNEDCDVIKFAVSVPLSQDEIEQHWQKPDLDSDDYSPSRLTRHEVWCFKQHVHPRMGEVWMRVTPESAGHNADDPMPLGKLKDPRK